MRTVLIALSKSINASDSHVVGDIMNLFSILNMIVFVYLLYQQVSGKVEVFSESYMQDGFCVSREDKSVWLQTHALCFYEDTCWAIIMYLIFSCCKSGMEDHPDGEQLVAMIRDSIASIFMHGATHMYIGLNEDEFYAESSRVPLA